MADEKHFLTDEQLKQVSGGDIISTKATDYVHKGCGGDIHLVEDYDDSFIGFFSEWSGGPARLSTMYRCAKCGQVFEEKTSDFVKVEPSSITTPGVEGYI